MPVAAFLDSAGVLLYIVVTEGASAEKDLDVHVSATSGEVSVVRFKDHEYHGKEWKEVAGFIQEKLGKSIIPKPPEDKPVEVEQLEKTKARSDAFNKAVFEGKTIDEAMVIADKAGKSK